MASTGYIKDGVYHRAKVIPLEKIAKGQQTMYKQGDHAKQRFDHSGEILQPWTVEGKPNTKFIEAYPDAAADYGFLPKREIKKIDPLGPSTTPNPGEKGYGGSTPWDYSVRQQAKR